MVWPGTYLPLGDNDLYWNNLTPNPSPVAPLPTHPLLSHLGNDICTPISTPSPSPGPVPAPILPTILHLKVADLVAISRIDKTLDKKQKNWTGWLNPYTCSLAMPMPRATSRAALHALTPASIL